MIRRFWRWYQKNYKLNLSIAAILFSLQLVHLFWLLTHVIFVRMGLGDWFSGYPFLNWLLILIDYTEIPALITTSLVYIHELKSKKSIKSLLYLLFLNIQLVHIFWITDEFLLNNIYFEGFTWWLAVLIDYLELPVILDTAKKALNLIRLGQIKSALESLNG